jgi:hypothetical protein
MSSSSDFYETNGTPSPGQTYNTLLNDSENSDLVKITKFSVIDTEKPDQVELQQLRKENHYLKAQLELVLKEKEMHIRSNAQEKLKFDKSLSKIKNSLESELLHLKRENDLLSSQNKSLHSKQLKSQSFKSEKAIFYKNQLEKLEQHYSILLNEKDRMIAMLRNELIKKKAKKPLKKHGSHRGSILSQDYLSPKVSYSSYFPSPKQKLDSISNLIVKLEKEQAVLKETAIENQELDTTEFNFKSLKELGERNKERFNQLQSHHRTYVKNRLSSEF